ncbi:helix-turn-helix transcriptional regulator [Amycolatopsis sp. K13G38]|uniref:Helix-turn-helix transcriptional regulator n=1 Tax=Amycolatopsis acididurans TaxID=2724524 RepID=A0ABX1JAP5_9PSEU|nr:helix-turn-helix domain-containing protein [Amycolatopsis acididurans]NKQ55420.1 helix-turn-helix transcriptional regulator [Amycolatopsis acididurans]
MGNERLRDALLSQGITPDELAERITVDPKTVERWITQGRTPYAKTRHKIAAILHESESYLWPAAMTEAKASEVSGSEIVKVYAHRNSVPSDLWDRLLAQATTYVDMLVYVGMFMTEKPGLLESLQEKAANGARIRLLFGDRDAPAVIQRSTDEGIGPRTISAKIDHALAYFRKLEGTPGIEIRTHGTVLYNSIFRFDDEMIANPHVYGKMAAHAPALHLRRLSAGDLFTTYADSFTAVWESAKPHTSKG